jgi:AcrR family transcriptional regulator
MAQTLKQDTQAKIAHAALALFAERGYDATTMEAIAGHARVSTGNIYRYYRNKQLLFHTLIDDDFVAAFVGVLRRRVAAARDVAKVRRVPAGSSYALLAGESLRFALDHRLRVVILLGRAQGSRYQGFAEKLVAMLCKGALAHFRARSGGNGRSRPPRTLPFTLTRIYRNYVATLVELLYELPRPEALCEAIERYTRYHRIGLDAFFATKRKS